MFEEPIFILNSDIDWASEYSIDCLMRFAGEYGIVPTAFVTHASDTLAKLNTAGKVRLGLHPNFLPGSSHGADREAVIDYVFGLVPDAVCYRSHCMVDDTHIAISMSKRGIKYDSNLCLYLQAGLVPLHFWTGIPRFPMFWSDDIHWRRGGGWQFQDYADHFFTPGLKIISSHPFMFALNLADQATYDRLKPMIPTLTEAEAEHHRHQGPGTQTFLRAMIEEILARGHRFTTLDQVYADYPKETII